jgi:hypothetical protein
VFDLHGGNGAVRASRHDLAKRFFTNVTGRVHARDVLCAWRFVGHDVIVLHVDFALEQFVVRQETDEYEDTKHAVFFVGFHDAFFARLRVFDRHGRENAVAVQTDHDRVPHEFNLVVGKGALTDRLHGTQFVASMNDRDFACEFREVDRLFDRGVATADHVNLEVFEEGSVAGRTVRNAASGEFRFTGASDQARVCAGRDDDGFRFVDAVARVDALDVAFEFHLGDVRAEAMDAEVFALVSSCVQSVEHRFRGLSGPVMPPGIVFNLVRDGDLTAVLAFFDQEGVQRESVRRTDRRPAPRDRRR